MLLLIEENFALKGTPQISKPLPRQQKDHNGISILSGVFPYTPLIYRTF